MRISNGFDVLTRERVLSATDAEGTNPEFWQEFHGTTVWKRFVHVYGATDANLARIVSILNLMYPGQEFFTLDQVTDVFITAIDSGGSASDPLDRVPVQVTEPTPAPAPLRADGNPMSESQQRWSEYRQFSESHSMKDCRERARVDSGYRSFMSKNIEREFEQAGDSVVPQNPHLLLAEDPSKAALKAIAAKAGLLVPQLFEWVKIYNTTPANQVRSLRSAAANPLGYEQYEKSFQAALEAHLI